MTAIEYESRPSLFDRLQLDGMPGALLLIVLVLACYGYTTSFSYIWDDDTYVINNQNLKDVAGLSRMWTHIGATPQYYPVTFTSFWLEYQLFGPNAARPSTDRLISVAHGVNMLLHLASVLMLWGILKRLAIPGALLAAAIFAVHPLNVESVVWVAERKNTLSLAFGMAALFVYLRYAGLIAAPVKSSAKPVKKAEDGTEDKDDEEGIQLSLPDDPRRLYVLFLVLFVCALLSKTTLSVLPGVILLITWWKQGRISGRDLKPLILPGVLALIAGSVTSYIERDPYLVGASGRAWEHGIAERLALSGQVTWFYVGKLFTAHPFVLRAPSSVDAVAGKIDLLLEVPDGLRAWLPGSLCFNYAKWELNASSPVQWLGTISTVLVVAALWLMRARLGRGALACVLIYLGCLFPAMGFVNVFPMQFSWVADHFAYVAGISLIVLFAAGAATLVARVPAQVQLTAAALLVVVMAFFTIRYASTFRNSTTLWTATILRNENSWLSAANLGGLWQLQAETDAQRLLRLGKIAEADKAYIHYADYAERWLSKSLKLNPNAYQAHYQLARLYKGARIFDTALSEALLADQIATEEGSKAYVYPKLLIAELLVQKGESDKARELYLELQDLEPKIADKLPTRFADARMRRASIDLEKVRGPISAEMSGEDLAIMGEVIQTLTAATEIAPNWPPPRLQLARLLVDLGQVNEALQELLQVMKVDANNPEAKYVSALAAMKINDFQSAGAQLSNLIQMEPGNVSARVKFAEALHALKRDADAIDQLREALNVNPNHEQGRKLMTQLGGKLPATRPAAGPTTTRVGTVTTGPATTMPATSMPAMR